MTEKSEKKKPERKVKIKPEYGEGRKTELTARFKELLHKKYKKELRIIHRWSGRITILAWIATIILGLFTPLAGIF